MKLKKKAAPTAQKTKPQRLRLPVTITLSEEAIAMGAMVAEYEGGTISRLIERWIREAFREGGLELPQKIE